jgi:DNA-binding LacI/PurR family transcriptional regulator
MNQRQIATALGVSQTTVSLVLNNPKTEKISREKRDLVLNFLEKNNYSSLPNNGKTKNLGYLFPANITSEPHRRFYDRFIIGIEIAASKAGYNVIVEKYKSEESLIFPHKKVDGVILEGKSDLETLKEIACRIPTVLLNDSVCEPICDMIYPDNNGGVQLAINFLQKQGHSRIAYFAATTSACLFEENHNQRLNAFIASIYTLKLEKNDDYIQLPILSESKISTTETAIVESLEFWQQMEKPPTAVVCGNDFYALQIIRQANLLGIKVPESLSIVGTDNVPNSEFSFPSLTSIDHNAEEMGKLAIEALIKRINNPNRPTRRISCNASLAIRESVADLNKKGKKIEQKNVIYSG